MFGAVIAQGRDYRDVVQEFAPGFDLAEQREARAAAGQPEHFDETDLYPDVRPALAELRTAGLWLVITGNQTVRVGGLLRGLFSEDVNLIGTSMTGAPASRIPASWSKSPRSSRSKSKRSCTSATASNNDIRPAAQAGYLTALIRRGPWGTVQAHDPAADTIPTMRVDSLTDLPEKIAKFNAAAH
ncbi:FMN phosphatase YigB (HAD superfamily) [Streptomyces sp. SPB162]|nr:FMN phosphatase YigB (HAD superfamily) [Streptomyces sp. SPB162]